MIRYSGQTVSDSRTYGWYSDSLLLQFLYEFQSPSLDRLHPTRDRLLLCFISLEVVFVLPRVHLDILLKDSRSRPFLHLPIDLCTNFSRNRSSKVLSTRCSPFFILNSVPRGRYSVEVLKTVWVPMMEMIINECTYKFSIVKNFKFT